MNQKSLDKNKPKELDRTTEISIGELNRNKLVDEITSKELSKPKELDWEKEFDKKFGDYLELNEGMIGTAIEEYHSNATRKVKNFISRILTQQRTELLKLVNKAFEETVIESEGHEYGFYEKLNSLLK